MVIRATGQYVSKTLAWHTTDPLSCDSSSALPQLCTRALLDMKAIGALYGTRDSGKIAIKLHHYQCLVGGLHAVQIAALPEDMETYFCCTPRLMALSAIDPSLAIGFYCQGQGTDLACNSAVL